MLPVRATDLPPLTEEQICMLQHFVGLEVTLEDVRDSLRNIFSFNFLSEPRTSEGHFRFPEHGVLVQRSDVMKAKEHQQLGMMSEVDLMHWATMILHNYAFEIDLKDEDFVTEELNDLSLGFRSAHREQR